jgi:hypothetical protein
MEILAVCSEVHKEHTNTLCGQNVEFLDVNLEELFVNPAVIVAPLAYILIMSLQVRNTAELYPTVFEYFTLTKYLV